MRRSRVATALVVLVLGVTIGRAAVDVQNAERVAQVTEARKLALLADARRAQAEALAATTAQRDQLQAKDLGLEQALADEQAKNADLQTKNDQLQSQLVAQLTFSLGRGGGPTVVGSSTTLNNKFAPGQCTWFVASKRYVPWNGDAWMWWQNAAALGFPEGSTPRVGSIMVTWESGFGHVAYVESVIGSIWTVSEMNYVAPYVIDRRTLTFGMVPLVGFIY